MKRRQLQDFKVGDLRRWAWAQDTTRRNPVGLPGDGPIIERDGLLSIVGQFREDFAIEPTPEDFGYWGYEAADGVDPLFASALMSLDDRAWQRTREGSNSPWGDAIGSMFGARNISTLTTPAILRPFSLFPPVAVDLGPAVGHQLVLRELTEADEPLYTRWGRDAAQWERPGDNRTFGNGHSHGSVFTGALNGDGSVEPVPSRLFRTFDLEVTLEQDFVL